jgi:hypothetical protein
MAKKKTAKKKASTPARSAKKAVKKAAKKAAPKAAKKPAGKAAGGAKAGKFVYFFGSGKADGNRTMKDTLGGKGANLAEMTNAGLPVPPGFTISTDACRAYYAEGRKVPAAVETQMLENVKKLEKAVGNKLGDPKKPLLVSVRSGAKFSMPGMMDTILNLGLNDETVESLKARTGNGRFAFDSYRRFIQMFGAVVLEIPKDEPPQRRGRARRADAQLRGLPRWRNGWTAHHPDVRQSARRLDVRRADRRVRRGRALRLFRSAGRVPAARSASVRRIAAGDRSLGALDEAASDCADRPRGGVGAFNGSTRSQFVMRSAQPGSASWARSVAPSALTR